MLFLYIKEHSVTGLKYFGMTTRKNPFKYKGSGIYWRNHITKHGKEYVKTIDIFGFDNAKDCEFFARNFSRVHNIVESKEWANQIIETGSPLHVVELRSYWKDKTGNRKGCIPWNKGMKKEKPFKERKKPGPISQSEETKLILSKKAKDRYLNGAINAFKGKTHNKETRDKMSQKAKERILTEERKEVLRTQGLGKVRSPDQIKKYSDYASKRFFIVSRKGEIRHCQSDSDERLLSGEFKKGKIWKD